MSNQNGKGNIDGSIEVLNSQKTIEEKEKIENKLEKKFGNTDIFKNIFEQFPDSPDAKKLSEKIMKSITSSYIELNTKSAIKERKIENFTKKYEISPDIKMEELAIIDAVDNKIGKYLEKNDKLKLIRLLGGFEIKLNPETTSKEIDKSKYSKEMLNDPNIPIIEALLTKEVISREEFEKFIKNSSFKEALEKNPKIKQEYEKILKENKEQKNEEKFKDFLIYLPESIHNSYVVEQLEKNFVFIIGENGNLKDLKSKKINIFANLKRTLNNFLSKHKYFYKPDAYYKAVDIIRKDPGEKPLNEFFLEKLIALAKVMEFAGERPWEVEEKHLEAGEQKKAVELREEKIEKNSESSSPVFEKIKKLLEKNEKNLKIEGDKNGEESRKKIGEISILEEKENANNPELASLNNFFYSDDNPSDILSEEDEVA